MYQISVERIRQTSAPSLCLPLPRHANLLLPLRRPHGALISYDCWTALSLPKTQVFLPDLDTQPAPLITA